MGYSPERKAAVLKRMLPPNNLPVRQLSQEEGISEATGDTAPVAGSTPKTRSAPLKSETPREIGGQLL
jgi:hypothetical protein